MIPLTFAALQTSYQHSEDYPEKLCDHRTLFSTLHAYKSRLNAASDSLFCKEEEDLADVPFQDMDASGQVCANPIIWSDDELQLHLGDTTTVDAQGHIIARCSYTKPDPRCRFIFLWAEHSQAPLYITKKMLTRILSYHQVMPSFLEFLFLFGNNTNPMDQRYSGFREETSLSASSTERAMLELRRSGRRYQLCYNLKTVNCLSKPDTEPASQDWRIRQAAVYHSMDVGCGTSLWIITKGSEELKGRVEEVTGNNGRTEDKTFDTPENSFRSSLAVHAMLAHWASADWRWYIQWLEKIVEQVTEGAVSASRKPSKTRKHHTPDDLQDVQFWEERANVAAMVLDANSKILEAVKKYYETLSEKSPFGTDVGEEVKDFSAQMQNAIADLQMQSTRTRLLVKIISQRKALILQHLQSQASEEMATFASMSQKEALVVRIITVVTLIYLPATFVSVSFLSELGLALVDLLPQTFFSTDIVKYQGQSSGSPGISGSTTSFEPVAMYRWLQVTLPLMFITFVIAGYAYFREKETVREALLPMHERKN